MSDNVAALASVLRPVRHVLLDFDGPVCSIYAGYPASEVCASLAKLLSETPGTPPAWADERDPLALLRRVADERPELVSRADDALAEMETKAAQSARPTPGVEDFLKACAETGRSVWIVSNNAKTAIDRYLALHGLEGYFAGRFGRIIGDPTSMKPSPRLLTAAMTAANAGPSECIFVGDAVRDVQAAHAAGMRTIGYANKPGKDAALAGAGAVAVVTEMRALALAVDDGQP